MVQWNAKLVAAPLPFWLLEAQPIWEPQLLHLGLTFKLT